MRCITIYCKNSNWKLYAKKKTNYLFIYTLTDKLVLTMFETLNASLTIFYMVLYFMIIYVIFQNLFSVKILN